MIFMRIHFFRMPVDSFRKKIELCNLVITQLLNIEFNDMEGPYSWRMKSSVQFMALLCKYKKKGSKNKMLHEILLVAANERKFRVDIAEFYNMHVDTINIFADFEFWERNTG
jgi:hypothetical protein